MEPEYGRRGRRQTYTFVALFVTVLAIGALAAGVYWRSGTVSAHTVTDAASLCPAGTTAEPAKVQVVVYNSTDRAGLAAATARSLKARHVDVLATSNSPDGELSGVATVTYGMYGRAQAATLAREIKGKVKLVGDNRTSTLIDLTLGKRYVGLRDAKQAAALIARKPAPAGCVRPDSDTDLASGSSS